MTHYQHLEIYYHDDVKKEHGSALPHIPSAAILSEDVVFQNHKHDQNRQHTINNALSNVFKIDHCVEVRVGEARVIDVMVFLRLLPVILLVEDSIDDDGECCVESIEELVVVDVEDDNGGEVRVGAIGYDTSHMIPVLEEVIGDQTGILTIPLPTVVECDEGQVLVLPHRNVSHSGCFGPLVALHSHSNIGCQNHVHIIGSVSDSQCKVFGRVRFDIFDDVLLLDRRTPVANYLAGVNIYGVLLYFF